MADHGVTEWESETTRLVRYTSHKKGPNFPFNWRKSGRYYERQGRQIEKVIVHQSAGPRRDGVEAVDRMAEWITRAPKYNGKRWIGGGRGFPGVPYTFLVPHRPEVRDNKLVIYRLWGDEWVTWHTRRHNRTGVGVCFAGSFRTRHAPGFSDANPTAPALEAGRSLILDYLLPRYGLTTDDLSGHFELGKSTCPGDCLEALVRRLRGETVTWWDAREDEPVLDRRPLRTFAQRCAAFASLGYADERDLSDPDGWRMALESFQGEYGLVVDGLYGPMTEKALRIELAKLA